MLSEPLLVELKSHTGNEREANPKGYDFFQISERLLTPAVVVGLAVVAFAGFHGCRSEAMRHAIPALCLPLFIAFAVLRPTTWLGRCLDWPPVRWIGRLSYSIYHWQQLFLYNTASGPFTCLQGRAVSFLAILACAVVSYYLIERPMIRVGHLSATAVQMSSA